MDKNVQASLSCVGNNFFPLSPEQRDGGDGGQQQTVFPTEDTRYQKFKSSPKIILKLLWYLSILLAIFLMNILKKELRKVSNLFLGNY